MSVAGRDGGVALPGRLEAPRPTLVVQTGRDRLGALVALVAGGTYLKSSTTPGRRVVFELVEMSPELYGYEGSVVDAAFEIRYPGAYWRDTVESTTSATPLSGPSVALTAFTGITAPIPDAVIRVRGAATAIQVTDAAGSWFSYPSLAAGSYLRFHAATGRAFVTSSDTWSGGQDVSGVIDFGGNRGSFEITPQYTTDPLTRSGLLVVTTASRSGAEIQVRGRGAYIE
ncbi:hypothetical protein ACIP5T_17265 [Microbacterium sp. NPDC088619]|uniref:hypothetical protein n=1 Tax=Microbacterium sp. NPDC088619 TaxID=3364196 RepID=UPI0038217985